MAPVEMLGNEGYNLVLDYQSIMRRRFRLSWTASNCTECAESRGRCGFDIPNYEFFCFCTDRPHIASCKPTKKGNAKVTSKTASFAPEVLHTRCLSVACVCLISILERIQMCVGWFLQYKWEVHCVKFYCDELIYHYCVLAAAKTNLGLILGTVFSCGKPRYIGQRDGLGSCYAQVLKRVGPY
ncbi:uncharacterized protein LOC132067056 [Lycium ferocissimum]|uniref:uncharacterized protein LOC132067056 n=1 Tax=Lycium ferocissimum TaxID=112874 RepID=UPI0028162B3F|nr:uncharacterized protein LOC132067056 [Lycium ferocissimum]